MKVCILGNTKLNYSWFVLTYRQGLQLNGHEVLEIDYRSHSPSEIRDILFAEKPKYVFTHLTFHAIYPIPKMLNLFEDIRKHTETKFVHILCDAREVPRYSEDISRSFYMSFLNQTKNRAKFQSLWKIPVVFAPYCALSYNEMSSYNKNLDYKSLIFMGSMSHRKRNNLITQLKTKMPLKVFQTQSAEDKRSVTHELVASNKAILSACTGYDIDHFNEVRPWQLLGSGACMIHKKFKAEDDLIPDDLYFHHNFDADEIKDIYNRISKEDTSDIRSRAFNFIQKYHSSKVRLKNIMNVLEGKQATTNSFIWEI